MREDTTTLGCRQRTPCHHKRLGVPLVMRGANTREAECEILKVLLVDKHHRGDSMGLSASGSRTWETGCGQTCSGLRRRCVQSRGNFGRQQLLEDPTRESPMFSRVRWRLHFKMGTKWWRGFWSARSCQVRMRRAGIREEQTGAANKVTKLGVWTFK